MLVLLIATGCGSKRTEVDTTHEQRDDLSSPDSGCTDSTTFFVVER
jgi:hypothetical protein